MTEVEKCSQCEAPAAIRIDESSARCVDHARELLYAHACAVPSDINEHMPLLRELASRCRHVTEFGMRWARGSTLAFLAAQPEVLISWDLDPANVTGENAAGLVKLAGKTRFQPRTGDTLQIAPIGLYDRTDLLFIDTLHTAKQLLTELERHVDPKHQPVRKFLVFHDTKTFGLEGEDGSAPGLRAAIQQFQKYFAFPLWKLKHANGDERLVKAAKKGIALQTGGFQLLDLENNNGLVVLEHICADGHSPERSRSGRCLWCTQVPESEGGA